MRFVSVIAISGSGHPEGFTFPVDSSRNYSLHTGDWTIHFETDPQKPALVEAWRTDNQAAFSSSAGKVTLEGKTYPGKIPGSSLLIEITGGKAILTETGDRIPDIVKSIPVKKEKQAGKKT